MHNWFICKIRYEKVMENGMNKKVTEPYLVDALSFTEAESRIIEEMTPFISGEFTVSDIKRVHYSELFLNNEYNADKYYDCRLEFITLDEKSGAEKKTKTTVLVQAASLRDAMKKLDEGMKGTMADYNAVCIKETAIMNVYPYVVESENPHQSTENKLNKEENNSIVSVVENDNRTISTPQSERKEHIYKTISHNDIRGDD